MPLNDYLTQRLPLLDAVDMSKVLDGTITEDLIAMENLRQFSEDDAVWNLPADVTYEDVSVSGPHGDIRVRVYRPQRTGGTAMMWVHGGGFMSGTIDQPEAHVVSAEICSRAAAVVVSVDYRLATSTSLYPVPLDDVRAAWDWTLAQAFAPRTVIGGASAGSALALATAALAESPPTGVMLAYPFVHYPVPALDDETAREMMALHPLLRFTPRAIEEMVRGYVGRLADIPAPALPGHMPLTGLADVSIMLSEYDDLRPSGELLARQLMEAGVDVTVYTEPGVLHGHLNRLPHVPGMLPSILWMVERLRRTTEKV